MTPSFLEEAWGGTGRVLASGTLGLGTGVALSNNLIGYAVMAGAFLAFELAMTLRRRRLSEASNPVYRPVLHGDILTTIDDAVGRAVQRHFNAKASGKTGEGKGENR